MAALKLITSSDRPLLRISSSNTQAEMAALKLITPSDRPKLRIASSNGATRCHCPLFSQAEEAAA
eukprot:9882306-Karenia_brevis.AAC.1